MFEITIDDILFNKSKILYGFFLNENLLGEIAKSKRVKDFYVYDETTDSTIYDYFEYKNNSTILFDLTNFQEATKTRMDIMNWIYEQSNSVRGLMQNINFLVIWPNYSCPNQFEKIVDLNESQMLLKPKKVKEYKDYNEYLKGNWFRNHVRKWVLEAYEYKCAICGEIKNLHIHHNDYTEIDIYGHDISSRGKVVLCDNCHERITACTRDARYKKRSMYYV